MQKIIIDIPLEGETTISVTGVKGKSCKDLTRELEEKLGKITSSTPTGEMYERESIQNRNRG